MYISYSIILAFSTIANGWMPGKDHPITARDGTNLFASKAPATGGRWLPTITPIRGVNLGSLFIFEPWIASVAWKAMGCSDYKSEFGCVSGLGQTVANAAFAAHWDTWYNETDIQFMASYGINTIRVPVGYWMREDLVYESEYFPQGGLVYLERLCGWASAAGLYVILDLHGLPGVQTANNSFTGQYAPETGFYVGYQFERALKFLEWMTNIIHTNPSYNTVGMLEIVNEPTQDADEVGALVTSYYPNAFARIRAAETNLSISTADYLTIQTMSTSWGSGSPTTALTPANLTYAVFDTHRYLKWSSGVTVTHEGYINASCLDGTRLGVGTGNTPLIIGEWSLAVADSVAKTAEWDPTTQQAFYTQWFAAQVQSYEQHLGWVFWNWKSQLGTDYRWSYKAAVDAGVIPTDLGSIAAVNIC